MSGRPQRSRNLHTKLFIFYHYKAISRTACPDRLHSGVKSQYVDLEHNVFNIAPICTDDIFTKISLSHFAQMTEHTLCHFIQT